MPQDKDFFDIIKYILEHSGRLNKWILESLYKISKSNINQDSRSIYSRSGLVSWMILTKLLAIRSVNKSIGREWKGYLDFGKDVIYKIKNSSTINWRSIMLNHARQCTKGIEQDIELSHEVSQIPCFILDDTDIKKSGKCMEWIGKIYSHVSHDYTLGYKSLNLAYWSSKHLLHLDFSFHIEMGKRKNQGMKSKELKNRYTKKRQPNSPGFQRESELAKKKTKRNQENTLLAE